MIESRVGFVPAENFADVGGVLNETLSERVVLLGLDSVLPHLISSTLRIKCFKKGSDLIQCVLSHP